MKIDVLQFSDVSFGKFSWWSNWIDVAVFDYSRKPHLLQMKISRKNGKRFRSIDITGSIFKMTSAHEIGDLMPTKRSERK